jgi:membrane-associated phospholipid phosphatase
MGYPLPWIIGVMLVNGLCVFALKRMISRPRPLADPAPLIEAGKVRIHVLGRKLRYRSFPSGHTQTAFAVRVYLSLLRRRWAPFFFSLAIAVGLSRIYMEVHLPPDVIGGGLVGVALASGAWWLRERLVTSLVPPQT